jgi:hypothetical protein
LFQNSYGFFKRNAMGVEFSTAAFAPRRRARRSRVASSSIRPANSADRQSAATRHSFALPGVVINRDPRERSAN